MDSLEARSGGSDDGDQNLTAIGRKRRRSTRHVAGNLRSVHISGGIAADFSRRRP